MENQDKHIEVNCIDLKPQPFNISFNAPDGTHVGKLYITKDGLVFEGDAKESAKLFFDEVIKKYIEYWSQFNQNQ